MTIPNPEKSEQIAIIQIVFPAEDDVAALGIKSKIEDLLKGIPRVKLDFRLTRMRDNG